VCDEHVKHQYPLSYAKELRDVQRKYSMSKPKMEKVPLEVGDEATAWSRKTGTCLTITKKDDGSIEISSQDLTVLVSSDWEMDKPNHLCVTTSGSH
jgi:hypothetical protein